MGAMRNTYDFFALRPECKRPLRRPRSRWKENIKMDLKNIVWKFMQCARLYQWQAAVNLVMNPRLQQKAGFS
jgi:hypothetical protein